MPLVLALSECRGSTPRRSIVTRDRRGYHSDKEVDMLEFVTIQEHHDKYGKAFENCSPTRTAHGPGGLIALEHRAYGISRIFHRRDDGRITYVEGHTDIHDFNALFDSIKQRYGLVEQTTLWPCGRRR